MERENKAFNGEIVVVVDDEYWMDESLSAVVTSRQSGKTRDFSAKALAHTISARLNVVDLQKANADSRHIARAANLANYLENTLRIGTDPELMELILDGRMQVAFLLNSGGGDGQLGDIFMDLMDDVAKRQGETQAYVTSIACSAAFDNMAYADRPFLLDESVLGWHLTTDADTGRVVEEAREKDLAELYCLVNRAKEPFKTQFLQRITKSLKDPATPEGKIYFYGVELALAGCVERGFEDVKDMRSYFGTQFWSAECGKVQKFWENSASYETET